ncbi:MAG: T9SS type A sorting domain-containing protein [Bacteroidota bacterium]
MKTKILLKIPLLFFLLFNISITNAQMQEEWVKYKTGLNNGWAYGSDIAIDAYGNIYVTGECQRDDTSRSIFLIKYNSEGDTIWSTIYNGDGNPFDLTRKVLVKDGFVYVFGRTYLDSTYHNLIVFKYDTLGVLKWSSVYPVYSNLTIPLDLAVSDSGNVYITCMENVTINKYFLTMKYDLNGNIKWINSYSTSWESGNYNCKITIDQNENSYIACVESQDSVNVFLTLKYNSAGIQQWSSIYTHPDAVTAVTANSNFPCGIAVDTDGNVYVAGRFSYTNTGYDMILIKYNSSGDTLWTSIYNRQDNSDEMPDVLYVSSDGSIYVAGISFYSDAEMIILKYDSSGNILNTGICENMPANAWYNIKVDDNGNAYASGEVFLTQNFDKSYIYSIKCDVDGEKQWDATFTESNGNNFSQDIEIDNYGNLYVLGIVTLLNWTNHKTALIKYCEACRSIITGTIFQDINGNCVKDTNDVGLSGWLVKAEPGPYYGTTDSSGYYNIFVPQGTFTVSRIPDLFWQQICPSSVSYTVILADSGDVSLNNNFAEQIDIYCSHLEVDITSGALRPCMNTIFSVNYCNTGTVSVDSVYIEVEFDTIFTPVSSTLPWSSQNNNIYTFDIGTLQAGQCGSFLITALVSCYAILGSTHCTETWIYPDTSCFPNDSTWDHSSVAVEGECVNDSLACFTIYNTGDPGAGDMQSPGEYRIYENNVLVYTGQFQLAGGDSLIICWPTNGNAIRLEADQSPGHPGNSHPQETIEDCGDSTGNSLGQIILIPEDDMDDNVEIDCKEIIGSWDPNEKWVKPVGLTQNHYIDSADVLEYQINFQNTGTDTAFTIIIRDTLSQYLDASTVVAGASSHPNTFRIYGQGILEWRFDHVMLPDSNTNEPASHGFVKFKVNQSTDNIQGTLIENTAGIIFDYNSPMITDVVWNIVYDTVFVTTVKPVLIINTIEVNVFPNPFNDYTTFVIKGMNKSEQYNLILYDLMGKEMKKINNISGNTFNVRKTNLPAGMYFYKLYNKKETIAAGKIIIN